MPEVALVNIKGAVHNVTGPDVSAASNGASGSCITGSGGAAQAAADRSAEAQAAPEQILGTSGDDVIRGDGGRSMGSGFARFLDIDIQGRLPVTLQSVSISGLPTGWIVTGAAQAGSGWLVTLPADANAASTASKLTVIIQYAVASDALVFT